MKIDQTKPVTVITGASDGIGAQLAYIFAKKGYELLLIARRRQKLTELAREITTICDIQPTILPLDLTDPEALDELSSVIVYERLSVQHLINNAGFGLFGWVAELPPLEQLEMLNLNIQALTALTLRFLPDIRRLQGGVLNVASTAAFMPVPGAAVYAATKAYVASFSDALHEELKPSGVKVSCLCPGPVATGFQARAGINMPKRMPGLLPAEEVALQGYQIGRRAHV